MITINSIKTYSEDNVIVSMFFESKQDVLKLPHMQNVLPYDSESYNEGTNVWNIIHFPYRHDIKMLRTSAIDMIVNYIANPTDVLEKYKHRLQTESLKSIKCLKTRDDAVLPNKSNVNDSGFDLTLLKKYKDIGKVTLYHTGIKVRPPYGFYFDLVPRSSIIKSGYILANSVGIIDQEYRGEIFVPLIKIDPDAADLELPCRLVQLIPRKFYNMNVEEVSTLDITVRNEGGFGSTGK